MFPQEEGAGGEGDEERHDRAAGDVEPQEIRARGDDQPQPEDGAGDLFERLAERLLQGVGIESLEFEHDRPKGQDDEDQPLEVGKRTDGLAAEEIEVRAQEAQGVRKPKRRDHQDAIGDLKELEIEFLFSTKHRVCCRGASQET